MVDFEYTTAGKATTLSLGGSRTMLSSTIWRDDDVLGVIDLVVRVLKRLVTL